LENRKNRDRGGKMKLLAERLGGKKGGGLLDKEHPTLSEGIHEKDMKSIPRQAITEGRRKIFLKLKKI